MDGWHPLGGRLSRRIMGDRLSPEDAVLSYHDVRLTSRDIEVIREDWLNDNCIAFWQEYLEHDVLSHYPQSHVVLLRPSMAMMLLHTVDPLSLRDALPDFSRTTHVFVPINDNLQPDHAEGGSHWSLLLVSLVDGMAFHYDSMHGSNCRYASVVTERLSRLVGRHLRLLDLSHDSPQQNNGSDCGVYVCMIMKHLLVKRLLATHNNDKITMSMGGKRIDAGQGRREMLRLIDEFRREGRRSGSRSRSPYGKPGVEGPPRIGD